MPINVTVMDQGVSAEIFNVTAYANATSIASQTVTLTSGNSTTLTFTWNATGFDYGNYTISAYAWPVPGETDTADNNFTDGWAIVAIVGDITGLKSCPDGKVDMRDLGYVGKLFLCTPGDSQWDSNADINGDGKINMLDLGTVAKHFLEQYP
jgi:hypothetical protein